MPTAISHPVIALGLGPYFLRSGIKPRLWILGAIYAALPDIDSMGFQMGIPYAHFFGHRGFLHSLAFALLLAGLTTAVMALWKRSHFSYPTLLFLFLCTSSHGILDAMTNGGLGVAFFSPFNEHRYFFRWQPIEVSPISMTRFVHSRASSVLRSEFLWVILPSMGLAAVGCLINLLSRPKRRRTRTYTPRAGRG